jgi:hypothetical protein
MSSYCGKQDDEPRRAAQRVPFDGLAAVIDNDLLSVYSVRSSFVDGAEIATAGAARG